MSLINGNSFADRQAAAAKARQALAEKFRATAKYDPNDPGGNRARGQAEGDFRGPRGA